METVRKHKTFPYIDLTIRYNKHAVFLGIVIFFNLGGFYLLSGLPFDPTDIAVVLEFCYFVYILVTRRGRCAYRYRWAMLMPVVLMVSSAMMANYSYGQPLWLGLRAQRAWVMAFLMYFPVTKVMRRGEMSGRHILAMLDVVNTIYILLALLQYALGDSVQFMAVQASERYGSLRLYISLSFVLISYFIHLMRALQERKVRFGDIFFIVTTLFLHLSVVKGRMSIVCLLAGTGFAVLSIRFTVKKFFLVGGCFVAAIVFLLSDVGDDILSMVFNRGENLGGDTSAIRDIGREFFMEKTFSDWKTALFGCGFANIEWPQTVTGIRYREGIYANDNGIFGLTFYYGLVFVVWVFAVYAEMLVKSWKSDRAIFFLLLADIIKVYTLYPLIYGENIAFVLVCCLLEYRIASEEGAVQREKTRFLSCTGRGAITG